MLQNFDADIQRNQSRTADLKLGFRFASLCQL